MPEAIFAVMQQSAKSRRYSSGISALHESLYRFALKDCALQTRGDMPCARLNIVEK